MGTHDLGFLDLILLVASMAMSAIIGLYFTNKNKSIDAYMLGDRKLSVIPVAVSLMTSCLSGLSLLGSSSELYYQGPTYSFVALALLLCGPITAYTILPVFYKLNELSLYKYLERRYGTLVKYIVTTIFILQMVVYNSVVLYIPAMALQSILAVPKFYSVLIIGLMCVLYSGIGGLKAVVWTDLFQAILMYAAIITVGVMGTYDAGGFARVFEEAAAGHRMDLTGFFNLDITTRHTLMGLLIGSTLKHVYLIGVNQVQIQRALSLPTLRQGQHAFLYCSVFAALMSLLSSYMGVIVYSAYKGCDPFMANEIPRRDAIVVHYVAHRLYSVPGLRGVFIAGVFSATLSTLSSFANSMAALALEDFIKPVRKRLGYGEFESSTVTWLAKALATIFGVVCVLMAYVVEKANSRLLQATTTMFGAIGVPFLASFALGIFTRFTNTFGIIVGFAVTLSLGAYITIHQTFFTPPLAPTLPVFYDGQCARIFNMTLNPRLLPSVDEMVPLHYVENNFVKPPFSLNQISYMMLPGIQFVLMIIVSSLASILSGGWNQKVDERLLVKGLRSKIDNNDCGEQSDPNTKSQYNTNIVNVANEAEGANQQESDQRRRKLGVANKNGYHDPAADEERGVR